MEDKNTNTTQTPEPSSVKNNELDPNWAHEAIQELEDFIESQGVYIRQ
jgi:hypothetical protein